MSEDRGVHVPTGLHGYVGEGFHTAFRKAGVSPLADRVWLLINEMPDGEWTKIANWFTHNLVRQWHVSAEPAITPTPLMVAMYPDFWVAGPGHEVASRVQCGHEYNLTDSCPGCDAEFGSLEGVVRALLGPNVHEVMMPLENDLCGIDRVHGGHIVFGVDQAVYSGWSYTVYDADDEVITTDGGGEDDKYKVAAEIVEWVTRKPSSLIERAATRGRQ
jgi:hypothetical protein